MHERNRVSTYITRQRSLLVTLLLAVFMGALDLAIVSPAFPALRDAFDVSARTMSWALTIYVLVNVISMPLMSKWSDRSGRQPVFLLDLGLFALGSMTAALAPTFAVFLLGRAIQAAGAGGIFPVANAVIGDTFPPERRGTALGLVGAMWGAATLFGPVIGVTILSVASWHWIFGLNIPLAAVAAVLALRTVPATRAAEPPPFDVWGAALLAPALAGITYGVNQFGEADITIVAGTLMGGLALLIPFVFIETRAADPLIPLGLFRRRQIVLANLFSLLGSISEAGLFFLPAFATVALGLSEDRAGLILLPLALTTFIGTPAAGTLLDRIGSRLVLIGGVVCAGFGLLVTGWFPTSWVLFIGATILLGTGMSSLLGPPTRYIIVNETSAEERGVSLGVLGIFGSIGVALGSSLGGALIGSGAQLANFRTAYTVLAVLIAFGIPLGVLLKAHAAELAAARAHAHAT